MRLVSLNTWKAEGDYPKRVRAMADGLASLSADVIALQEDLRTSDGLTHTALSAGAHAVDAAVLGTCAGQAARRGPAQDDDDLGPGGAQPPAGA